ncbi:MAG: serine/threonine protein kinase [Candidatus Obscuribacterales bacterium]|nr:serine/threonine protein kinase [Candidatus Obscuribacterales bacterium]
MTSGQDESENRRPRTWESSERVDQGQRETTWNAPKLFMATTDASGQEALSGEFFDHIPEHTPLVGRTIFGTYKINKLLGEGGMAVVYEGTDVKSGRAVAIKTLKYSEPELAVRFARELQIHSKLRHPNIVEAIASLEDDKGQPYFVMELLQGMSLEAFLDEYGNLQDVEEISYVLSQLCEALEYAHNRKVVHRDIKPENIIVTGGRERPKVSVLDFGLAKIQADLQRLTKTGVVLGSPAYMSPEQCTGDKMDQRSDLYSLGVVVYELVAGDLPFDADSPVKMMNAHCDSKIVPTPLKEFRPDLPGVDQLSKILQKLMSVPVESRHRDVNELKMELDAWWRAATSQVAGTISPFTFIDVVPEEIDTKADSRASGLSPDALSSLIKKQRETGIENYSQKIGSNRPAGYKPIPVKKILIGSGLGVLAVLMIAGGFYFLVPFLSQIADQAKIARDAGKEQAQPSSQAANIDEQTGNQSETEPQRPSESKVRKIRATGWVVPK